MDSKLFSIIIATYNCGEKVGDTLRSILDNDPTLFEIIVIDGASTDDTLDAVRKYEDRLTLISEPDGGVYHAFNKAIAIARGQYLYFIGAGDILRPGVLAEVREILPESGANLVYGKCLLARQQFVYGFEFSPRDLITKCICQQAIFYSREIFELRGTFDVRFRALADWVFDFECFCDEGVRKIFINKVIADYEEGGISQNFRDDLTFCAEFPHMVRKRLGFRAYLLCKVSLLEPMLVNSLRDRKFEWARQYLATKYGRRMLLAYLRRRLGRTRSGTSR